METKKCNACWIEYELSTDFFYKDKQNKDLLTNRCKTCCKNKKTCKEMIQKKLVDISNWKHVEKKCSVCWVLLLLNWDNFPRDKTKTFWFSSACRSCRKKQATDSLKKNRWKVKFNYIDEKSYWFVYILKCNEFYKIWHTQDTITLYERIRQIQTWNPYEIKKIHTIETKDRFKLEQKLHKKFKHKHIRWEWFELIDCDIEDILNYKSEV